MDSEWALSTLSINLQPFLCGLTQLSPLPLSGAHPKLQSGSSKNSRDVDTQDTAMSKWPFVASSFCLCWETALSGQQGSCRAAWNVSRAAQPGTKNQSRHSHATYRSAQKPGG